MRWNLSTRVAFAGLLVAGVALVGCRGERREINPATGKPAEKRLLRVYVGSSMRVPMEACMEQYRKEHPATELALDFGDSGDALARIREWGGGEALVLHEPYLTQMMQEGIGVKVHVLANMRPAIVMRKDDPKTANVKGLKDLDNPNLAVAMTDASATVSGGLVQAALKAAGIQESVMSRHPYQNRSSGAICAAVAGTNKAGPRDIGTAWDAVARGIGLRTVRIEDQYMPAEFHDPETPAVVYHNGVVPVGLVVLNSAKAPDQTQDFVNFILSPAGQKLWQEAGFNPAVETPTETKP
jgi:sulfate/thiosulfate transport system substrate-binding protein